MHQTPFPNILAFVEGSMEKLFVNNNFRYVRLVPMDNGTSWTLERLCERIKTAVLAGGYQVDKVIIWLDREGRAETAEEMHDAFLHLLISIGVSTDKVAIMIGDRATENALLADEHIMKEEIGDGQYSYAFEGQNGKSVMKKLFRDAGKSYSETSDGVRLLKKFRPQRASANSPCVQRFSAAMNMECWWLAPMAEAS